MCWWKPLQNTSQQITCMLLPCYEKWRDAHQRTGRFRGLTSTANSFSYASCKMLGTLTASSPLLFFLFNFSPIGLFQISDSQTDLIRGPTLWRWHFCGNSVAIVIHPPFLVGTFLLAMKLSSKLWSLPETKAKEKVHSEVSFSTVNGRWKVKAMEINNSIAFTYHVPSGVSNE